MGEVRSVSWPATRRTTAENGALIVNAGPRASTPQGIVFRALLRASIIVAIVGLLAIGASGLLADAIGHLFGATFVSGDLPGVTYTPERCAELSDYAPSGSSCETAATLHHLDETLSYREAAGLLGLVAGCVWLVQRRQASRASGASASDTVLPPGFVPTAATALFGVTGVGLLARALNALALGGAGAGAWLSAAIVSLAAAAVFGGVLVRLLVRRATRAS